MMRVLALAILALSVGASAGGVSPVEKVITMLEDLQTQVITEGKAEATTYDKFACFCKDMTDDKTEAIGKAETDVDDLTARMNSKASQRSRLDDKIQEFNDKVAEKENDIKEAKEKRAKEFADFQTHLNDLNDALAELEAAKVSLKQQMELAAKVAGMGGASLVELEKKVNRIARVLSPALSTGEVKFDGHLDKIIDKVMSMEKQTKVDKAQAIADEQAAEQKHDKFVLQRQLEIGTKQKQIERTEERRDETSKQLAATQQELTLTLAQLHDDQSYLKDLTAKCEDKSKEYDQRSTMRQDELAAITQALTILGGTVSEKTSDKTVRLVQQRSAVRPHAVLVVEDNKDAAGSDDEDEDEDVSFLQISGNNLSTLAESVKSRRFLEQSSTAPRHRLIELLKTKSEQLKSTVLASLAAKAQADPFAKIKQLVDELIGRLLQEAADEASHKGWCDKSLTAAKQQRGLKSDSVREQNTELEWNEAKRDKLSQTIDKLETEIAELTDSLDETTKQREAESEENATTVSEAEEGQAAIEKALDVLKTFYGKAKDAEVESLVQKGPEADDLPDTGFSGANKGSQSAATGILGMMEVIQSDFIRTIRETNRAEKAAETDFLELERTTKVSITDKETALSEAKEDHSSTVTEISDGMDNLRDQQDLLNKALQELEELRPACIDTGMSYEERVARREQEVEALKEALCIIDKGSAVQTEASCE